MGGKFSLKYTSVDIETDDADGKDYHGYMAIQFNYSTDQEKFFMESVEIDVLARIKAFFARLDSGYEENDVSLEDISILINLKREDDKRYAPNMVAIMRHFEENFDDTVGKNV